MKTFLLFAAAALAYGQLANAPQPGGRPYSGPPAVLDPVDGANGQLYEYVLDLSLGGPLNFAYGRYYGSRLSAFGFVTPLGPNWMSPFDVVMGVSGSTAQVLVFPPRRISFTNSASGWALPTNAVREVEYQLAAVGTGYQLMDPTNKLVYTFNQAGALTRIADRNGYALTLTQGTGGPTQISDGVGRTLTLAYTNGRLTSVVDQAGRTITFAYTDGNLTSVTDPMGNTTSYAYATGGLLTQKTLPSGRIPTTQTYDSTGRVVSQTDPGGNTTTISYEPTNTTTITNPAGQVTKNVYGAGNLLSLNDSAGGSANFTQDAFFRRTRITDKLGNHVDYTYHAASGYPATSSDRLGNVTTYTYTPSVQGAFTFYDLTTIAYADGTTQTRTFDKNGNLTSVKQPNGSIFKNTYDTAGRLTSSTDAVGQTSTFTYNPDFTLASSKDALGNTTSYTYDAAKAVATVTDANGGITSITRNDLGLVTNVVDATGASSSTRYDADGRLADWTSPLGGVYTMAYTPTGKTASTTDPLGNTTTYTYDNFDRLLSEKNAAGEINTLTYDSGHRIASLSNAVGQRFTYAYDLEGNLLSTTDAAGRKSSSTYDAVGDVASVTTPTGNKTTFAYNKRQILTSKSAASGGTQTISRDEVGNMTQISMPGNLTSSIKHDANGRVVSITTPNGNTWNSVLDGRRRLSKLTDPLGVSTTMTYQGDHPASMTLPLGTLNFSTDENGRVTQQKYSDGTVVNRTYDAMGLLKSADGLTIERDLKGQPTNVNGMAIAYTPAGRPASVTYADGKTVNYTYDLGGRVISVEDWVGGKTTFTYDASGNVSGVTFPNGVATTYSYDADSRITKIAAPGVGSITLTRDGEGKITAADRSLLTTPVMQASAQQLTYDAAGQVTASGTTYDKMGRVMAQNGRTYTWNLASQLTGFVDGVNSGTLTYDGLGGIASSTASGTRQDYVLNYVFPYPALSIVRQDGSDLRYYVYAPEGQLLYSVEANENARRFYHFDEMGNTTALTGDDGAVTDTYAITPYGDIADHPGASDNPFTWQGQYGVMQEARGLFYMRSRHYDAFTARFLSRDRIKTPDPRGAEPYAYGRGNPLMFVDPFGDLGWEDLQGAGYLLQRLAKMAAASFIYYGEAAPVFASTIYSLRQCAYAHGQCVGECIKEGQALQDFVESYGNGSLTWLDLKSKLTDHASPGPLAPPILHTTGAQPLSGGSTCLLAGCGNNAGVTPQAPLATALSGGGIAAAPIALLIGNNSSTLIGNNSSTLIGNNSSTLIGNNSSTLIGNNSSTLIGNNSSTLIGNNSSTLIGNNSSTLIGNNSSTLIGNNSSTLIGNNSSTLIGNNSSTVIGN